MIINNIKTRIIEYFFMNPTKKLRIRQIERETGSPLPSVIRYVKELIEEELLKKEDISKIAIYSANRINSNYLLYKKLNNIESIYTCGLIEYLKEHNCRTIILFGSYSKGEDIEESDIDIYIECKHALSELDQFEKKLQRRIQIFQYINIHAVKNKELANNIINGIIIEGFIEAIK
jgi:predicted nucleotidyltransferase